MGWQSIKYTMVQYELGIQHYQNLFEMLRYVILYSIFSKIRIKAQQNGTITRLSGLKKSYSTLAIHLPMMKARPKLACRLLLPNITLMHFFVLHTIIIVQWIWKTPAMKVLTAGFTWVLISLTICALIGCFRVFLSAFSTFPLL